MYIRPQAKILEKRLAEPRRFIQVVEGPRQAGKTTLVRQVLEKTRSHSRFVSADEPELRGRDWIVEQWSIARIDADSAGRRVTAIEVKSGTRRDYLPGMKAFADAFKPHLQILVGEGGIPLEEFLLKPVEHWLGT